MEGVWAFRSNKGQLSVLTPSFIWFFSPCQSGNTVPTQLACSSITYRYKQKEDSVWVVGSSSKEPSQRSKVGKIDQWKVHTLLTSSSATLRILTPFWKAQMAQEHGRGRIYFFFCTKGDWMKFNIRLEWIWIWFCFTKKREEKWPACILARFWKNTKCSSLEICSAKINA